jgi:hypothetical protein
MTAMCEAGTHFVQKLPEGKYICVYCGAMFHESHELVLTVGATSAPHDPRSPG